MGTYYKSFIALAVLIFVVMFAIVGIGTVVRGKRTIREAQQQEATTVTVRYYMSEEDTSTVLMLRVAEGSQFSIEHLPRCASDPTKRFVGLCNAAGVMIVDANGQSLQPASENMLLYPRFEEVE